jgi:hypothetical protein
MTTDRELLEQALEALEHKHQPQWMERTYEVITAIREHLANTKEPEPVAWEWVDPIKGIQLSHNEPADYEEVFELRPLFIKDQL